MTSLTSSEGELSARLVQGHAFAEPCRVRQALAVAGDIDQWVPALSKLLAAFDGALALVMPDGSSAMFGRTAATAATPAFTLRLQDPAVLRTLLLGRDPLRFAEAYFRKEVDVEGDLFAALSLKDYLQSLQLPLADRFRLALRLMRAALPKHDFSHALRASSVHAHSRQENREAIAFHYDISNRFYGLWLDRGMVYSCAYFENDGMSLDDAQAAKLEHICRKLQLVAGQRFLDIGCGWGALIMHAARHYGVQAHGITLSEQQFEMARERIHQAGLNGRASVELADYRDLHGTQCYDRIASVGMFEHVGLKKLPSYFKTVHRLLKPDGVFLNHGITHEEEGWGDAISSQFINRYVFPDGELDTISNIQRQMERAKLEIVDVEGLRPHYARTLRMWVQRLEQGHARALQFVNEATFRVWRLYMAASALEFESGALGVYQILATQRAGNMRALPLTRCYMYPHEEVRALPLRP